MGVRYVMAEPFGVLCAPAGCGLPCALWVSTERGGLFGYSRPLLGVAEPDVREPHNNARTPSFPLLSLTSLSTARLLVLIGAFPSPNSEHLSICRTWYYKARPFFFPSRL